MVQHFHIRTDWQRVQQATMKRVQLDCWRVTINFTLFDGNEVRVNAVPYVAGVAAVVPVSIVLGGYMTDDAPLFLNDVLKITSPNIPVYVVKEYLEENGRTTTTP